MKNRHKNHHKLTKRLRFSILLSSISLVFGLAAPAVFPAKLSGYSILEKASADAIDNTQPIVLNTTEQQAIVDVVSQTPDSQLPDVSKMNQDQKQAFTEVVSQSIDKTLDLPTDADKKDATNEMVGVFDSTSGNRNNLAVATQNLVDDIDDNHSSPLDPITGENAVAKGHGWISVGYLAAFINIAGFAALTYLTRGGFARAYFGARSSAQLIRQYGINAIKNVLKKFINPRLGTIGLYGVTVLATKAIDEISDYLNPGFQIARYIDAHDYIRNNSYIEATR